MLKTKVVNLGCENLQFGWCETKSSKRFMNSKQVTIVPVSIKFVFKQKYVIWRFKKKSSKLAVFSHILLHTSFEFYILT